MALPFILPFILLLIADFIATYTPPSSNLVALTSSLFVVMVVAFYNLSMDKLSKDQI